MRDVTWQEISNSGNLAEVPSLLSYAAVESSFACTWGQIIIFFIDDHVNVFSSVCKITIQILSQCHTLLHVKSLAVVEFSSNPSFFSRKSP